MVYATQGCCICWATHRQAHGSCVALASTKQPRPCRRSGMQQAARAAACAGAGRSASTVSVLHLQCLHTCSALLTSYTCDMHAGMDEDIWPGSQAGRARLADH